MTSDTSTPAPGARRLIPLVILAALTIASGATAWLSSRPTVTSTVGPEGVAIYSVPDLAAATTTRVGQAVDGITCQSQAKEVVKYHVHIHVSIFVYGREERLPAGIGITRPALIEKTSTGDFYDVGLYDCLYWLHTHAADGIIHVEAPARQVFTLGEFFDIWRQPLSTRRVGPVTGPVVVFENGQRRQGDPRDTPLLAHANIQIDVGTPVVAYHPFSFTVTGGCGEGTNSCSPSAG